MGVFRLTQILAYSKHFKHYRIAAIAWFSCRLVNCLLIDITISMFNVNYT